MKCYDAKLKYFVALGTDIQRQMVSGLRFEGAIIPLQPRPLGMPVVARFVKFGALFTLAKEEMKLLRLPFAKVYEHSLADLYCGHSSRHTYPSPLFLGVKRRGPLS